MNIEKRFPCVADLEAAALPRLPKFVRDNLTGGVSYGVNLKKNRQAINRVELLPRFLSEDNKPDLRCRLFGHSYDAPFGVAPMGLAGLIWPNAEGILATAAKSHNLPYILSTVGTTSLEDIGSLAGENAWFQLYPPKDPAIRKDILRRCQEAGYNVLVVTVDTPFKTRREHDIRNGLSVPPRFDLKTIWQILTHPNWALRVLRTGIPRFENLAPYFEKNSMNLNVGKAILRDARFIDQRMGSRVDRHVFKEIRGDWPGKLVIKGVLDSQECKTYLELGADALIVSNHGGRQLDAAPSVPSVLPQIRKTVGPDASLIADSGIRSGLDIARMISLGANFVLLGRPFMYAVAALDRRGGDHVMNILKAELQYTMGHLGCCKVEDLPDFLLTSRLSPNTEYTRS